MPNYVFASVDCAVTQPAGPPILLRAGSTWAADDPFVLEPADLFTDAPVTVRRTVPAPVESATRAPGERRPVRSPRG